MKFDKLSQWISVIANVGVFLGFVIIAYQLQLNTVSLKASSINQASNLSQNAEIALMGDTGYAAVAKSILTPSELSPAELMQVWSYFSMANYSASQAHNDFQEGLVTEEDWNYSRDIFISYINFPIGRVWWDSHRRAYTDTKMMGFIDAVQERLDETPKDLTQKQFVEMIDAAKKLGDAPGRGE